MSLACRPKADRLSDILLHAPMLHKRYVGSTLSGDRLACRGGMVAKLTLFELSAAANEVAKAPVARGFTVIGTIAKGDADYAEVLFAAPSANPALPDKRVAVGVRRNQPLDQARASLVHTLRKKL